MMNDNGKHQKLPPVILRRPSSSTVFNFRRQEELSSPQGNSVSHMYQLNVDKTTISRSQQDRSPIEEINLNIAESNTCNSEYGYRHPCVQDFKNPQQSFEISSPVSVSESEMCKSHNAMSAKKLVDTALPTCLQTDGGLSVGNKIDACFLVKEGVPLEEIQQSASCPSSAPESVSSTPVLHSNDSVLSSSEVTSTEISHSTPVFHVVQPQFYLNSKDAKYGLDIRNLSVDIPISDVPPTLQPGSTIRTVAENQPETTSDLSVLKVQEAHISDLPVLQKCGNDEAAKITQSEEACVNLPEPAEIVSQRNADETVTSTQPEEIPNVFVQPQIIGVFSLRNIPQKNDTSSKYQCPKCLKRFHRILSQLEHKCNPKTPSVGSLHKVHSVKLYKCLECYEEFSDVDKKKSHACSSQVQAKSKNSDQASSVNGKSSLKKAATDWCRTPSGTFKCNICKRFSFKESKMRKHCKQKHADHANQNAGNEIIKEIKENTSNTKSKKVKFRSSSNQCSTKERTGTQHHKHNFDQPFKCGLCSMRYKRVPYLKKHIALHKGSDQFKRSKRPYVCRLCKLGFHDSSTLRVHSMKKCIHTKNAAKQDQQDDSSSSGNEVIGLHVREQNTCLVSKNAVINTSSEDSTSSLLKEKHFPKRKHRCGFCGILCESPTSLKKHVRTHWNEVFESYSRPLECCLCNEQFANCVRFFLHVRRNSCSSTTTEDTSQSSAIELSDGEARGKMECDPAMSTSNSASHQEEQPHLKGMHQCQFCNLNFWTSNILDIHLHSSHPLLLQTEETVTSNSSDSEADRDSNDKNKDQETPDPGLLNQQSKVTARNKRMQTKTHRSHHVPSLKKPFLIQGDLSPPTDKSEIVLSVCESNDLVDDTLIQDGTEREEDTEISKRTQIYPSQCKICKITLSSWKSVDAHCQSHHADHLYKHLNHGQSQAGCSICPCSMMEPSDDTKIDVIKVNLFHSCDLCERVFKYWKSLVFHQKLKHGVHVNSVRLSSRRQKSKDDGKQNDRPSFELNDSILDNNTSALTNEVRCESPQELTTTQTLSGNSHDNNNLALVAGVQNENVPSSQEYQNPNQNQSQPSKKGHSLERRRTVEDLQITQVVSLKSGELNDLWNSGNTCSSVKKDDANNITERRMQPLCEEVSSNHQVKTHESQRQENTKPNEITSPDLSLHSSFNNKQLTSGCTDEADVQQAILDEFKFLMNSVVTLQSTMNNKSNISSAEGVIPCDQYEVDEAIKKLPFKEVKRILKSLERNCDTNAYHCSVCGEILDDIPQYTSHILAHCDFDQYICVFCGQRSLDIFSVLNHVVLTHRVEKVLVAQGSSIERVSTSSPTSTSDVLGTAADQPSTSASPQASQITNEQCTYPRPRFDYIFKPKEHELNITQDEKTGQYKCPACQFKYMDRADVIYHLRMYHNGHPYICKHCPENFYFYPDVQAHFFKNHFLHVTQQGEQADSMYSAQGGQCSQQQREITTMQPNFQSVADAGSCDTESEGFRKQKSCDETASDESEVNTGCCRSVDSKPAFIDQIHTETNKQTYANNNPGDDERIRTPQLQESKQDAPPLVVVKQEKLSDDVIDEYTYYNLHHHLKGQITIKTEKLDDGIYPTTECMQQTDIDDSIQHQSEIEQDRETVIENDIQSRIVPGDKRDVPDEPASCLFSHDNSSVKVTQSENNLQTLPRKIKVEKDVPEASQWGLYMEKEICSEVELSDANKSDSNDAVVSSSVKSEIITDISTQTNPLDSTERREDGSHVKSINLDVDNQLGDVEDLLDIANEMGIALTESLPELQSTCCQKINPGDFAKSSNRMVTQSTETSGSGQTDNRQLVNKRFTEGCRELASPHTQCKGTPQDHKECQLTNPLDTINPNPFQQNETMSEILRDIAKNSFTSRIRASLEEDSRILGDMDLQPSPVSSESNSALTVSTSLGKKRQLEPFNISQKREGKKLKLSDDNSKNLQATVAVDTCSHQVGGKTSRYEMTFEDLNEVVSRPDAFNQEITAKACNMSQRNMDVHQSLAAVPENTLQESQRGGTRSSELDVSTNRSNYERYLSNMDANYERHLSNMEVPVTSKKNNKQAYNVPVCKSQKSKQQLDTAGNVWPAKQICQRRRHCSDGPPLFSYHQEPSLGHPRNRNQSIDKLNNSNPTVTQGHSQGNQTNYSETLYSASINVMEHQMRRKQCNVTLPQHRRQVRMDLDGFQQNYHSANNYQQNSSRYFEMQTQRPGNESQIHGQFSVPPRQHRSRSPTLRELLRSPQTVNCLVNGNDRLSSADRLPDHSNCLMNSNNVAFNNYTGRRGLCSNNVNLSNEQPYPGANNVNLSNEHPYPGANRVNLSNEHPYPVANRVNLSNEHPYPGANRVNLSNEHPYQGANRVNLSNEHPYPVANRVNLSNEQPYQGANNMNLLIEPSYPDVHRRNLHLQSPPNGIPNVSNNDYIRPIATCVQPVESVGWDIQSPVHPTYPQPLHTNNQSMVSPRDKDQRECMPKILSVLSLHPDYVLVDSLCQKKTVTGDQSFP